MGEYSRNNQQSYDDAFFNQLKTILILLVDITWVIKTPCLFYFRSVKFHYVEETHMMLVAF